MGLKPDATFLGAVILWAVVVVVVVVKVVVDCSRRA